MKNTTQPPSSFVEMISELRLPSPLRPYQYAGIYFLYNNAHALLADEMGLGKTVQVTIALEILYKQGVLNRALIVVPAALKLNWYEELRKWTTGPSIQRIQGDGEDRQAYYRLPINILVASYEEVRLDIMDFVNQVRFDIVVLDEAQLIKNPSSKLAFACKLLGRERSWALTGTPVENKLNDLISIFRFVKGGLLHKSLPRNEIHSRMQPYFLRRRKAEVATELPPIIDQEILIELQGQQREAYFQIWDHRFSKEGRHSRMEMLVIITKLKQICNYDPTSEESAKLEILNSIIDGLEGADDKLIVFSQFVETLKWLSTRIGSIPQYTFWGGLTQDVRNRNINKFRRNPGPSVLLVSLRAGGVGLNIQEASTVVLFDRWWNPAVESQAIQRAHRFGRKRPLQVMKFLVISTIEERISNILSKKQVIFENYIETATNAELPLFDDETLMTILELPN